MLSHFHSDASEKAFEKELFSISLFKLHQRPNYERLKMYVDTVKPGN